MSADPFGDQADLGPVPVALIAGLVSAVTVLLLVCVAHTWVGRR